MVTLTVLTLLYFLPTVIAAQRGHGIGGIFILNFLFGWTAVGWFVLLAWALVSRPPWCYVAVPVYHPYNGHPHNGQLYQGQPYSGWRRY